MFSCSLLWRLWNLLCILRGSMKFMFQRFFLFLSVLSMWRLGYLFCVNVVSEFVMLQMSLYIGNLSEHSQRDDLERVFRRFGHCNVQLKRNGYGFVVFDFPLDAEKALRALKGRNICGEPLTLTWSNKQPSTHFSRIPWRRRNHTIEITKLVIYPSLLLFNYFFISLVI